MDALGSNQTLSYGNKVLIGLAVHKRRCHSSATGTFRTTFQITIGSTRLFLAFAKFGGRGCVGHDCGFHFGSTQGKARSVSTATKRQTTITSWATLRLSPLFLRRDNRPRQVTWRPSKARPLHVHVIKPTIHQPDASGAQPYSLITVMVRDLVQASPSSDVSSHGVSAVQRGSDTSLTVAVTPPLQPACHVIEDGVTTMGDFHGARTNSPLLPYLQASVLSARGTATVRLVSLHDVATAETR